MHRPRMPRILSKSVLMQSMEDFLTAQLAPFNVPQLTYKKPLNIERSVFSGSSIDVLLQFGLEVRLHVNLEIWDGCDQLAQDIKKGQFPLNERANTREQVEEERQRLAYIQKVAQNHGLFGVKVDMSFPCTHLEPAEAVLFAQNLTTVSAVALRLQAYVQDVVVDITQKDPEEDAMKK